MSTQGFDKRVPPSGATDPATDPWSKAAVDAARNDPAWKNAALPAAERQKIQNGHSWLNPAPLQLPTLKSVPIDPLPANWKSMSAEEVTDHVYKLLKTPSGTGAERLERVRGALTLLGGRPSAELNRAWNERHLDQFAMNARRELLEGSLEAEQIHSEARAVSAAYGRKTNESGSELGGALRMAAAAIQPKTLPLQTEIRNAIAVFYPELSYHVSGGRSVGTQPSLQEISHAFRKFDAAAQPASVPGAEKFNAEAVARDLNGLMQRTSWRDPNARVAAADRIMGQLEKLSGAELLQLGHTYDRNYYYSQPPADGVRSGGPFNMVVATFVGGGRYRELQKALHLQGIQKPGATRDGNYMPIPDPEPVPTMAERPITTLARVELPEERNNGIELIDLPVRQAEKAPSILERGRSLLSRVFSV